MKAKPLPESYKKPKEILASFEDSSFKRFFSVDKDAMVKNPNRKHHGKKEDAFDNYVASKVYDKNKKSKQNTPSP